MAFLGKEVEEFLANLGGFHGQSSLGMCIKGKILREKRRSRNRGIQLCGGLIA